VVSWKIRQAVSVEATEPQFIKDGIRYHPAYTKVVHLWGGFVLRDETGEEVDVVLTEKDGHQIKNNYPRVKKIRRASKEVLKVLA
jgi:hypothetical protein